MDIVNILSRYGRRTVTVKVGTGDNDVFDIHEDLLKRHSGFFEKALSGTWKESSERTIELEEEDPEDFEIFYHFLYTGTIFSTQDDDKSTEKSAKPWVDKIDTEVTRLANLWFLGDKLFSISFRDGVVDAMIAKMTRDHCVLVMHEEIYPDSARESKIRKLLVDIAVWGWKDGIIGGCPRGEDWAEFFFDVAVALDKVKRNGRQGVAPYLKEDTCIYHEHGEGQACYKTMF